MRMCSHLYKFEHGDGWSDNFLVEMLLETCNGREQEKHDLVQRGFSLHVKQVLQVLQRLNMYSNETHCNAQKIHTYAFICRCYNT